MTTNYPDLQVSQNFGQVEFFGQMDKNLNDQT